MCDYTYFDTERNCLKSKIRVNEISFGSSVMHLIILAVYSTGCYDKCLRNGEHQKLF